jgi:hypothetical protein
MPAGGWGLGAVATDNWAGGVGRLNIHNVRYII